MESADALAGGATSTDASASSSSSQPGTTRSLTQAAPARKRTPGRWRRIPRVLTPGKKAKKVLGQADQLKKDIEERNRWFLQKAEELEAMDANDCDSEEAKITFLAERPKEVAFLRRIANISPEDIVFRLMHPAPPHQGGAPPSRRDGSTLRSAPCKACVGVLQSMEDNAKTSTRVSSSQP